MLRSGILVACGLVACRTTTNSAPPYADAAVVTRAEAVYGWEVREDGELVGYVVRFETGDARSKTWYSVRNRHQQELGIVDAEGRVWRYRPHQREPEWLGTGTVARGANRILEASDGASMIGIPRERLSELRSKSNGS